MSFSRERSKLAIFSIVIAVLGIILAGLNLEDFGLTFIFIAALSMSGSFVYNRLKIMGAEAWALGSIFVWFGFVLFAFPVLAFAWNIFPNFEQLLLVISGVLLIILGFTTEYYDLNVKFLKFWQRTKKKFNEILTIGKEKFLRSIWTGVSTILMIYLLLSFIFIQILEPISIITGSQPHNIQRLLIFVMSVIFLAIEFRQLIILTIQTVFQFFMIILNGIVRRVVHIPSLIKKLIQHIKAIFIRFGKVMNRMWHSILYNTYILAFMGFITIGIKSFVDKNDILYAIALLMLFIGLMMLLFQKPDQIADRISQIQHIAYRRSTIARNYVKRVSSNECLECGALVSRNYINCYNCNNPIPKCSVCKSSIFSGSEILRCEFCEQSGHLEHLKRWIQIKPICPHCRRKWS